MVVTAPDGFLRKYHSMKFPTKTPQPLNPEIDAYYRQGREVQRLFKGIGQLERCRTQEIIRRFLPDPPGVVIDVGGGPGTYALWLARFGYEVHLVDRMLLHVDQANEASRAQPDFPLASCTLGDAVHLGRDDESADAVLLLGPLYHLQDHEDRIAALQEARRILKPGGLLFSAAISRFASLMDGLDNEFYGDPDFIEIVRRDLLDGHHYNPNPERNYFTTAYFHHPDELKAELETAGLEVRNILAIEGPGWIARDFDRQWQDPIERENILKAVRWVEEEPSLMGMSCHIMGVAGR